MCELCNGDVRYEVSCATYSVYGLGICACGYLVIGLSVFLSLCQFDSIVRNVCRAGWLAASCVSCQSVAALSY